MEGFKLLQVLISFASSITHSYMKPRRERHAIYVFIPSFTNSLLYSLFQTKRKIKNKKQNIINNMKKCKYKIIFIITTIACLN